MGGRGWEGGVEVVVCECGEEWHILDTCGRCAGRSENVSVCVGGEGESV